MSSDKDSIQYCLDIILKEARLEDRLTKQLFYVTASAYTNNPLNLAINSPSGEGKNWVIKKVTEKFPQEDVIRLSGMTSKAIFHRQGINVIKNEDTGEYEPLDDKLEDIDSQIWEKEQEINRTNDKPTKSALKASIMEYEHDKSELSSKSKKLIDLSHKVLIFLDTPPAELLGAIMTLLSHDEYETEYYYVDTHNGIRTRTNVLRGWPAVIFAQATDMGNYRRYEEIQRRFIFTNPRMDRAKYEAAIDLTADSFGIPDFMYQAKVLDQQETDKCKALILQIKTEMLELVSKIRPDKNQRVFIPFSDAVKSSLPKTKGFDMTTSNRLYNFLSLLPIINYTKRPRLVTVDPNDDRDIPIEITPIALFEDLQEAISIMEYSSGLRPYQLEWYEKVFLVEYRNKTTEDSRYIRNQEVTEKIIAVTTEQLARRTKEVFNRYITSKKILETYLEPLMNEGYIDKTGSDLDHRSNIYYPLVDAPKVFDYSIRDQSNNILHIPRIIVRDIAVYPYRQAIISKIEEVYRYSIRKGFRTTIKNNDWNNMTPNELADRYYDNVEGYFEYDHGNDNSNHVNRHYPYFVLKKHVLHDPDSIEYPNGVQIATESDKRSSKVFDRPKIEQSNNIQNECQSQSPYESLILIERLESGQEYYRCKIHPDIWRTDLTQIEGHCRNEHDDEREHKENGDVVLA